MSSTLQSESKSTSVPEDDLVEQLVSLPEQDLVLLKAKIESERRLIDALLTDAEKRGNYDEDWHVRATRAYRAKGMSIFRIAQELAKRKSHNKSVD
ncbi:MAG: hypothetical protein ABL933_08735 [Methyloglobulus sp.]|nr:hypothetical protein [Methyloglobulus sp.]